MKKLFISLFASLLTALMLFSAEAHAATVIEEGDIVSAWGENESAHWTLDSDGVLTFEGDGILRVPAYDASGADIALDTWPWIRTSTKDAIRSIVFEEGVTGIGYNPGSDAEAYFDYELEFNNLTGLEEVTLPSTMSYLSGAIFADCTALKTVTFSGNTELYYGVFSGCTSLTSITVPGVGEKAFRNCTYLKSVTITEDTSIGGNAFDGCTALETVNLPQTLTKIGASAFANCSMLEEIYLPQTLSEIGGSAFKNCTALSEINFPEKLGSIGTSAFSGCVSLTSISVPRAVAGWFEDCDCLKSVTITGGTVIGSNSFSGCTSLETVNLPQTLTNIETAAFKNCSALTEIVFPGTLQMISSSVFDGCTGLTTAKFQGAPPANITPENTAWIDSPLFGNREVTLLYPDSMETLWQTARESYSACYGNQVIWSPFHSTVNYVAGALDSLTWKFFVDTGTLEITGFGDLNIPEYMPDPYGPISSTQWSTVPWEAYKQAITRVVLGNGVTSVGYSAFAGCVNVTDVELPTSLIEIGMYAFDSCSSLTSISLPAGIQYIGYYAFKNCVSLTSVEMNDGVLSINPWAFEGCTALKSVTIPDSVKEIYYGAFQKSGLETVNLGQGIMQIYPSAFAGTALNSVFIPRSVKRIGDDAFRTVSDAKFEGDAPYDSYYAASSIHRAFGVGADINPGRQVTVRYPADNTTWAEAVAVDQTDWESRIIWAPYGESEPVDISRCTFTLEKRGYVYDGTEKKPGVTGYYGETPMTPGTDYSLRYANNINAGSATVTMIGAGRYQGEAILSFEIARAEPKLSFESASLNKQVGDGTFTNRLTATTDGTVTYRSSDPAVATVNASTGRVTVAGKGTAVITADAAQGRNYARGSASFTLTVAHPMEPLTWEDLSFQFSNSASSFGYASGYVIPYERYEYIYEPLVAKVIYESYKRAWGGSCFGFSSASVLLGGGSMTPDDFGQPYTRSLSTGSYSGAYDINIRQLLESLQVSWWQRDIATYYYNNYNDLDALCGAVELAQTTQQYPVIALYGNWGGHAIVGYKLVHVNAATDYLYVYDPNYPFSTNAQIRERNEARHITLKKQGDTYVSWYYKINDTYDCGSSYSDSFFTHIPFAVVDGIWKNRGANSDQRSNLLTVGSRSFEIYDYADNLLAAVNDNVLTSYRADIFAIRGVDLAADETPLIYLPTDTYRIVNNEGGVLRVGMVNLYQSATVETTASSVILSVSDEARINQVQVDGVEGDQYLVTLCSELAGDEDIAELQFSGQTGSMPLTVGVSGHDLSLTNCPGVCMLVNGVMSAVPGVDVLESIADYAPALEYTACVYDGTAKIPNVLFGGDYELKQNVDYVLAYENNTKVGQAKVTVWGVGSYTGNVVLNFNIVATEAELCPNGHQWDEGVITRRPSFTQDGTTSYTCRVCGAKQTESLSGLYYYRVSRSDSAVTVSLTNNTATELNARFCLVGYDESGKMTCLNMKTIALGGGDMTQLKLSFGGNAPARIKAMLLDNTRMIPIGAAWLVPQ